MTRGIVIMLTALTWTGLAAVPPDVDPSESPLWQAAVRSRGLPAVHGDTVFAVTTDHAVVALALDDGRERWRRSTGERGWTTEGARVVVVDDVAIAGDWDLYAYDVRTGQPRWAHHPAEGYAPGYFLGAAAGTRVFTGSPSGRLYAVDGPTGRALWTTTIERAVDAGPLTTVFEPVTDGRLVLAGYTVFASPDQGGVVAVAADDGRERWRFRFPQPDGEPRAMGLAGGPVIEGDLVAAASADGRIWGLDVATGAVRWSIPGLQGPFDGIITRVDQDQRGLAIVGDRLVAGSLTGYLTAYDLATRQQVWQREQGWLGSLSWRDYTHANGVVYVPFISGFLHAIDAPTGALRWRTTDYRQGLAWPVLVVGDRVIATGASGIWAFRAATPAEAPSPGR